MMFNKKAQVSKMLNFVLALAVLAGGALPLLSKFGVIGEIPAIPILVIQILTVIAGIVLLFDGFLGSGLSGVMPRTLNFITAFIALIGGIVPLLGTIGVIGALPEIPGVVFHGLLVLAGTVLLLDGILGARDM